MILTRLSLGNPVAVMVAVILTVLFGVISLYKLPIQLIPEIQEPQITISTNWRAAAPNEVEAEIVEPQEDVLRGLPGMTELLSTAQEGRGEITLTFSVDMDLRRALIEVLNRLNQVPSYPDDADEPIISSVGSNVRAIAWFIVKTAPGNDRDIASYKDFLEEVVQTRFERVPGVARSEVIGGRDREIRITFDPYKLASLGVQLPVVSSLAGTGKDISGGTVSVGKRDYSIRFVGKYNVADLESLVIDWRDGRPVYLRDVARVEVRLRDKNSFVITKGSVSVAINAQRETGVNVLDVMAGLREAVIDLREGTLARAGLEIEQVYDETIYIDRSIGMLKNNLGLGILLAAGVLWWFLRKFRATLIISLAIPICLLASFLTLYLSARTLNIISLAGLAFAVGMVLDASIIVLENIIRLREQGEEPQQASLKGTTQIWGALLASTMTTVAIFLPIIFLKDEAGQLFADLALTITATICVSLIVAVTVIPTFAAEFLPKEKLKDPHHHWWTFATRQIMRLTNTPLRRFSWIAVLITLPIIIALVLLPKADYLPEGNRNLVFAFILPPPGANIEQIETEIGQAIKKRMEPYLTGESQPQIEHYFFVAFFRGAFLGVKATDPSKAGELVAVINEVVSGFPDTIAFAKRTSLFGGFGAGRTVDMNIQSSDIGLTLKAASFAARKITEIIPGAKIQPFPELVLAEPELRLIPNDRRIAEAGWNRGIMASIVRALGDGLFVGDYFDGEQTLDIIVRAESWDTPEELASIPLATPNAGILPVGELVKIQRTSGPVKIRRINRRRSATLRITPPENVSLQEVTELLNKEIEPEVRGMLPEDGDVQYTGTADKLKNAIQSMQGSFLLAIIILYLLMSALFQSFKDSLLVLMSIPLATVGGVVMLNLINVLPNMLFGIQVFQPMDILTMIGFIILLGLVVNNAILLVHQSRLAERQGLSRRLAVEQAVSLRLRPILMSTLTSIFGMLPLLLVPGAGTELYRGLAGVIVGGIFVSTIFTLILLPSLLRIGEEKLLA